MAKKDEIKQAIKTRGLTLNSWARVRGFDINAVKTFCRRYTDSHKNPNGDTFKQIDQAFIEDFGFSIRKDYP